MVKKIGVKLTRLSYPWWKESLLSSIQTLPHILRGHLIHSQDGGLANSCPGSYCNFILTIQVPYLCNEYVIHDITVHISVYVFADGVFCFSGQKEIGIRAHTHQRGFQNTC